MTERVTEHYTSSQGTINVTFDGTTANLGGNVPRVIRRAVNQITLDDVTQTVDAELAKHHPPEINRPEMINLYFRGAVRSAITVHGYKKQ